MRPLSSQTVKFHTLLRGITTKSTVARPDARLANDKPESETDEAAGSSDPSAETAKLCSLLEQISERLDDARVARSKNVGDLQEVAIELSVAIAAHIVKKTLDANELQLDELVMAAIEQLHPDKKITIRLHPLDQTNLNTATDQRFTELSQRMDVIEDSDLPRGSCLVQAGDHGLLSTLESRLENVRDTLLQGIEYARTKR